MTKYVYFFGGGRGPKAPRSCGTCSAGKGCELAEMTNLGIPVPPGFTVTTQAWAHYNRNRTRMARRAVGPEPSRTLQRLEAAAGAGFRRPQAGPSSYPSARAPGCRCPG